MAVYENNLPLVSDKIRNFPGDIATKNWPYLQTSLGTDHNFTNDTATASDGYHKVIHEVVQVGTQGDNTPAIPSVTTTAMIYAKTITFFKEGGTGAVRQVPCVQYGSRADALEEFSLAAPIRAAVSIDAAGLILGGSYNISDVAFDGSNTYTFTFGVNAPNTTYQVLATSRNLSAAGGAALTIGTKNAGNFTVQAVNRAGLAQSAAMDVIVVGGWPNA